MTSLNIQTSGLSTSSTGEKGYAPLTPSTPFSPTSSSSSSPSAPLYPNVNMGTASTLPHLIFKNGTFTATDLQFLAKLYSNVIVYGPLYYSYTSVAAMPNFSALCLDMTDTSTHTWVELNHTALVDKTQYFSVYLYKKGIFTSMTDIINATEALLPSAIITKIDPTIMSSEIWVQSLLKREIPKIKKGLSGFLQSLGKAL
jgi:hypothetical protein